MSGEVLCDREIRELICSGAILGASDDLVNPGSLDLRVDKPGHRLMGSFVPLDGKSIADTFKDIEGIVDHSVTTRSRVELGTMHPYLFGIREKLKLPEGISARVFNKSGRGRLGFSVNTLCDGVSRFDYVPAGHDGKLYAEICATTFPGFLTLGQTSLPQIRFYQGKPCPLEGYQLELLMRKEPLLFDGNNKPIKHKRTELQRINETGVLTFTADLSGELLAYKARRGEKTIDLDARGVYDPHDFFKGVKRRGRRKGSIMIHPGDFVLLLSAERIRLPPTYAAEIAEHSPELGDIRIHYAGLINPGHGYDLEKEGGDHIVFEVRARDKPVCIQHGKPMARFNIYKMSGVPEAEYVQDRSTGFDDLPSILPVQFKKST